MLENDNFNQGTPSSKADFKVKPDQVISLLGISVKFHHFPGHTPGCSAIEIKDTLFSGDFIFAGSIGRVDFPYSNSEDMKKSIKKVLKFKSNYKIYSGHGNSTTLYEEKDSLANWLNHL
jgi:glyoxylase-like metal-dependent hydrolase (beta-lactamase superfamily II)